MYHVNAFIIILSTSAVDMFTHFFIQLTDILRGFNQYCTMYTFYQHHFILPGFLIYGLGLSVCLKIVI